MDLTFFNDFKREQGSLITLLQQIQKRFGYLPSQALEALSLYIEIPLSRIYSVATFYAQFKFNPLGKYVIKACHGTACHVNGSKDILKEIVDELKIEENETTTDGLISLEIVACLGCCSLSPCIMINDKVFGNLTPNTTRKIIQKLKKGEL